MTQSQNHHVGFLKLIF